MSECLRESEVLDAIASRRWPARADAELRAHAESCAGCRDLAAVAGTLLYEEEAAFAQAQVPPAASVWHRAQLRAREEAARAATRPIGFVQGLAVSFGIAAVIGAAIWAGPIVSSLRAPSISLPRIDFDTASLLSNTTLQIAVATWAVLAPVALYFTLKVED